MAKKPTDPTKQVIAHAKRLAKLRDQKEELENKLKEINKEKADLEQNVLPKMMEDYEIEKMSIDGVGTLFTKQGVYCRILAEEREMAQQWFKDHGHGDIVKEYIFPQTLTSWVKEQFEEGREVPSFLAAKPTTTAQIRRK